MAAKKRERLERVVRVLAYCGECDRLVRVARIESDEMALGCGHKLPIETAVATGG